jgi:hypothetical protein
MHVRSNRCSCVSSFMLTSWLIGHCNLLVTLRNPLWLIKHWKVWQSRRKAARHNKCGIVQNSTLSSVLVFDASSSVFPVCKMKSINEGALVLFISMFVAFTFSSAIEIFTVNAKVLLGVEKVYLHLMSQAAGHELSS